MYGVREKLEERRTCREGHVWLHVRKRGWARDVTWIAGRGRWLRSGEDCTGRRGCVLDVGSTRGRCDLRIAVGKRALDGPGGVACGSVWQYEGSFV